jgi:CheY-like chemotaxis protein
LGLTISARLIEAMQGRLWLESEEGKGSCFRFIVTLGAAKDQAAALDDRVLQGLTAVVVDDNPTNLRILTEMLRLWGMRATSVASAPAALEVIQRGAERGEPYRIIVTDVHMPDMDGFDLVRRLRRDPALAQMPVLMLTSGEHVGDRGRCRDLNVFAYLAKPVRRQELRNALVSAVQDQHERTEGSGKLQASPVRRRLIEQGAELCILLAEDNSVNQRVACKILEKAGHRVVVASNGIDALSLADERRFDLILMDIQMPRMGGFEAAAAIRERQKLTGEYTPIIAMTAHAMEGDRERCLTAGMDDYIPKPIRAADLINLVNVHRKNTAAGTGIEVQESR